jgi:glycosyltransferase involved in cell wall biosynthesis
MKILMVVENCPYERDPRVRRETKALQAAGHSVAVICPSDGVRRRCSERVDEVEIYRFHAWPHKGATAAYILEYLSAMLAIAVLSLLVLIRKGFDVVHVANPPDVVVLMLALYKLIGKQVIYDQHDVCPELYRAKRFRNRVVAYLLRWLETRCYRTADHVIATNESYKSRALLRGIAESRISVVRNGPDLAALSLSEVDLDLRRRGQNLFVYSGMISTQDGLDCLSRALHQLRYRLGRVDFYCVIAGDDDALFDIRHLAQELRLDKHILFTGWISDSRTYFRLLNTADICLSPEPRNGYNNQSTFVKIMEFMAAGKPIVAFDLAETRISAEGSALYARPMDEHFAQQLVRLMDNSGLRHEMGAIGKRRIREALAWEYSAPQLLKVYDMLSNTRRHGRKGNYRENQANNKKSPASSQLVQYKSKNAA